MLLDIQQNGPGVLTSPGFPFVYLNDADCTWTVVAAEGMHVALNFTHFHIESCGGLCVCDIVQVRGAVNKF